MDKLDLQVPKPGNVSEVWWTEVCKKIKNAVVFLDNSVAESVHWNGGLERLIKAGCCEVKEFSAFETCKASDKKAVFLLGDVIAGHVLDTLKDIICSSKLSNVVIVTSAHPSVHVYALYGGREVNENMIMQKIEQQILEWLGNFNYTVEIFYFPLIIVPACEDIFLIPHFDNIFPIFEDEIPNILKLHADINRVDLNSMKSLNEIEFCHFPFEMRVQIMHLVVCLHSLFQGMAAREEIYSLGHMSRIVADELESFSPARHRRKTAKNKVSLIVIDRSLDLASPANCDNSNFMSRLLSLVDRLPGHKIDSAIDLSPLSDIDSSSKHVLLPGCLAHPQHDKAKRVLDLALKRSKKETIREIKCLVSDFTGLSRTSSLQEMITRLKDMCHDREKLEKHLPLIQQCLAVKQMLDHPNNEIMDEMFAIQKSSINSINDDNTHTDIDRMISFFKNDTIHSEDMLVYIITLLTFKAALQDETDFDDSIWNELFDIFSKKICSALKNDCLPPFLSEIKAEYLASLKEKRAAEDQGILAQNLCNIVRRRLKSISTTRKGLTHYRSVLNVGDHSSPPAYQPLVTTVMRDCFDPSKDTTEQTDLEYRSAGFKDIIKTGFSMFVKVSKSRPRDAALTIVFVLGGVTCAEAASAPPGVVVGSSHLASTRDVAQKYFANRLFKR